MGKYIVRIEASAKKELQFHYKSGNKATIKRIEQILKELSINPYEGNGNPEKLKYELSGFWSRRLNSKDRSIYEVIENRITVIVISALGHYD